MVRFCKLINHKGMKSSKQFFMGIDVSKPWFDLSMLVINNHHKSDMLTERFSNTPEGIQLFKKWLKTHQVGFDSNTLLVIENTGIYHRLIWSFCSKQNLPIHIGNAAHIKWSLGITRGKSDRIDSQRLCAYAYKHREDIKATAGLDPVLLTLKDLMTARSGLIKQLQRIKSYLKELCRAFDKPLQLMMEKSHRPALEGIKNSIKELEAQIESIIESNPGTYNNYKLIKSVPGIGHFTAVYVICCTNNFAAKISGKQLACYAGVVPFEHRSGISIKGKSRVHKMANKDLKKMLHLCALTAVKYYPEFRDYFNRKKTEGKNGLSVLNAIRNKLVLRIVAVVRNQAPCVNNAIRVA